MAENLSCDSSFSETQNHSLLIVYGSVGGFAVLICLVGLIMACLLRLYKKYVYRLAMYQVTTALFFGLARAMQLPMLAVNDVPELSHKLCEGIAYVVICTSWIKLVFTMWVTIHLFAYAVFLKNYTKLEIPLIVIGLLAGPLIAAVPLFTHAYGVAGPWCWIVSHRNPCATSKFLEGEVEQFAVWYGPALLILLINSILVFITISVFAYRICCLNYNPVHLQERMPLIMTHKKTFVMLMPLLAYPIIFCIVIVVPLTNRFYEMIAHGPNFSLFVASAVLIPGAGCAAGIAFISHIVVVERSRLSCIKKETESTNAGNGGKHLPKVDKGTASSTHFILINESDFDNDYDHD